MNLQYLIKYKSFINVEEMDTAVKEHIHSHHDQLTESAKATLYCLAGHSLSAPGASHLKAETIAAEIGVSVKTIYRATKKLVELGIITKHKTVKKTGQGASIYVIAPKINTRNVSHVMSEGSPSLETHVSLTAPTVTHVKNETVTKNLITSSLNPFVVKNVVNNVNACASTTDLKEALRDVYKPSTVEGNRDFEELCKIAFGRLKQYMRDYKMPYLQMESIVINCMKSLVAKEGVRSQFAMYSKMIERQVLQLFEQPIQPIVSAPQPLQQRTKEQVPEWFDKRNEQREQRSVPSTVSDGAIDFEAERQKILAKLG